MHPPDCEWWEYKNHPHAASALPIRCESVLEDLAQGRLDPDHESRDTRPLHERIFVNLTPQRQPYLAGHYRGEKFRCLRYLEVQIDGDARVGAAPARVAPELANFNSHILGDGLKALSDAFDIPGHKLSDAEKLNYLVKFSCRLLVQFLGIHPYANGNGHVGRLLVWLVLAKFGYWPRAWPLDGHPPYDKLLERYRDGDEQPLEDFVLSAIEGSVGVASGGPHGSASPTSGSNVTAIRAK